MLLVVLVVSVFLRSVRATLVPAVATVTALLGTFGVMYLLGFSLDNLSLMALTVATGFVVDDAIVVLENTSRHIEAGMTRMKAALLGAREVGFTVVSISLSLVAVFIPLLFMAGLQGRLVPRVRRHTVGRGADLARRVADDDADDVRVAAEARRRERASTRAGSRARRARLRLGARGATSRASTGRSRARALVMLILLAVVALNAYLFVAVPKSLFPQQDTGQLAGGLSADQSISTKAMGDKLRQVIDIVRRDPAVQSVVGVHRRQRARAAASCSSS